MISVILLWWSGLLSQGSFDLVELKQKHGMAGVIIKERAVLKSGSK